MATIAIVIKRTELKLSGECPVMLSISAFHKKLRVQTGIDVKPENFYEGNILPGDPLFQIKNIRLNQIRDTARTKLLSRDVTQMDVYALKEFLFPTSESSSKTDMFALLEKMEHHYEANKSHKSSLMFRSTRSKLQKFWPKSTLSFNSIDKKFLEQFETYCLTTPVKPVKRGVKPTTMSTNGIATYMRYLRIACNEAIDDNLMTSYPFRKYKITTKDTINRNLAVEIIRKIRDYKPATEKEILARDIFMLQFYLLGINLKDLFYLAKTAITDGRIDYYRFKTDRYFNFELAKEAQDIIRKYKGKKYLMWFADYCSDERTKKSIPHTRKSLYQYADEQAFGKMINKNLKLIQKTLKISLAKSLTSYWTRHSAASILRQINISKDDIALCLGHSSPEQAVTGIYINEDFVKVDEAVRELIDYTNSEFTDGKSWKEKLTKK